MSRLIVAPVGADGSIRLVNGSAGTVQLYADVAGYYRIDADTTPPGDRRCGQPAVRGFDAGAVDQSAGSGLRRGDDPAFAGQRAAGLRHRRDPGRRRRHAQGQPTPTPGYCPEPNTATRFSLMTAPRTTPRRRSAPPPRSAAARCTGARRPRIDQDGGGLKSISCPTETFCRAVDLSGNMVQFDGTGWSRPKEINATGYGLWRACPARPCRSVWPSTGTAAPSSSTAPAGELRSMSTIPAVGSSRCPARRRRSAWP